MYHGISSPIPYSLPYPRNLFAFWFYLSFFRLFIQQHTLSFIHIQKCVQFPQSRCLFRQLLLLWKLFLRLHFCVLQLGFCCLKDFPAPFQIVRKLINLIVQPCNISMNIRPQRYTVCPFPVQSNNKFLTEGRIRKLHRQSPVSSNLHWLWRVHSFTGFYDCLPYLLFLCIGCVPNLHGWKHLSQKACAPLPVQYLPHIGQSLSPAPGSSSERFSSPYPPFRTSGLGNSALKAVTLTPEYPVPSSPEYKDYLWLMP